MAGRVGPIKRSSDRRNVGFFIYDEADRACVYLEFGTQGEAERAAEVAQSLLVSALRCTKKQSRR